MRCPKVRKLREASRASRSSRARRGHMEGHNVMAAMSVGAAHAIKKAMEQFKIPGTIVLSIGPAEETIDEPALSGARRLFQRRRRCNHHAHSGQFEHRLWPGELCADRSEVYVQGTNGAWRSESLGRQGRRGCRGADGHRFRQTARTLATHLPWTSHDHQRRCATQHHSRRGPNLVVYPRCHGALGQRELR